MITRAELRADIAEWDSDRKVLLAREGDPEERVTDEQWQENNDLAVDLLYMAAEIINANSQSESSRTSDVSQVLMIPVVREGFEKWLATRGWECVRAPWLDGEEGDALPTYLTSPTPETMSNHSRAFGGKP